MNTLNGYPRISKRARIWLGSIALGCLGAISLLLVTLPSTSPEIELPPLPPEASSAQVHSFCGACHAYPPPDSFPRSVWRKEVKQAYDFFAKAPRLTIDYPPLESVVSYYEKRAPESLILIPRTASRSAIPIQFERHGFRVPDEKAIPRVTYLQVVHLARDKRPEILVCDTDQNQIQLLDPNEPLKPWRVLAKGFCCAHAEVVDLNRDGIDDIVLACLGSFYATDRRVGSVVWLKGKGDGTFAPVVLLEGIGRVADVQAADFNGDGTLDLVVAVFGWREHGEILHLENRTTDWSQPRFDVHRIDDRHGTVHVPIVDLNHDGKPDFVALISQEHETLVAFLNEGAGRFRKENIFTAPHPAFGSSGIQLVDVDGDADFDVLYTNGDSLDAPYVLKPYHGVQWLENRGTFPFEHHRLIDVCGAARAVAADLDGDGLQDVVVSTFLPEEYFPQRKDMKLDSILLLMQGPKGQFSTHVLESESCDHLTCAISDMDGDGRPDLVVGNFMKRGTEADAITVWKNRPKTARSSPP